MSALSSTPRLKSKTTLCQAWSPSPSAGELHLERAGAGGSCRDRFAKGGVLAPGAPPLPGRSGSDPQTPLSFSVLGCPAASGMLTGVVLEV